MPELDRSHLLNFLSKPRYVRDIAEHFGVSATIASYQLRKAVRSGDVLVSEKPLPQMVHNSHSRRRPPPKRFLYASRNSPYLVDNVLRSKADNFGENSRPDTTVVSIKFLSTTHSLADEKLLKRKGWAFLPKRLSVRLGSRKSLVSRFLDSLVSKTRLARRRVWNPQVRHAAPSNRGEGISLSHTTKIRLFQVLLDQPLSFLDIRGRFGVSKRTVMTLVKNGFLEEEWGPKDIGVRFGLTEKGKSRLEQLEAAARFEPKRRESMVIRLKHRISP